MEDMRSMDIDAAHVVAIRTDQLRIMLDCGHYATPSLTLVPGWKAYADSPGMGVSGGSGFSTDDAGFRRCYACSDKLEIERMRTADRVTGYLTDDHKNVTTWPGGILARVVEWHVSKAARKTYVRAVDTDGNRWYGSGPSESGTYVNLRRSK